MNNKIITLIRFATVAPQGDVGTEPTPPIGLAQGANKVIIGSQKKLKVKKLNFKLTISSNIRGVKSLTARTKA